MTDLRVSTTSWATDTSQDSKNEATKCKRLSTCLQTYLTSGKNASETGCTSKTFSDPKTFGLKQEMITKNSIRLINKIAGLMTAVNKNSKVKIHSQPRTLQDLQSSNRTMDDIQKHLETFLENKRKDFPRFFFLSNDELLQILAAAQDIRKVEKHLNKIFENINKLRLGDDLNANQISAIISAEGEVVTYSSAIKIRSEENVEATLKEIEAKMFETLK
jgi:Dynein heavy chain, N-terminal region 2